MEPGKWFNMAVARNLLSAAGPLKEALGRTGGRGNRGYRALLPLTPVEAIFGRPNHLQNARRKLWAFFYLS